MSRAALVARRLGRVLMVACFVLLLLLLIPMVTVFALCDEVDRWGWSDVTLYLFIGVLFFFVSGWASMCFYIAVPFAQILARWSERRADEKRWLAGCGPTMDELLEEQQR